MSDNGDDNIKFRDHVAIEVMKFMFDCYLKNERAHFIWSEDKNKDGEQATHKFVAITAYKIADAMRKARLGAFE